MFPNPVANDYKSHVVVNGVVTFWLISTSAKTYAKNSLTIKMGIENHMIDNIWSLLNFNVIF
jgi:hypothetical protein